MFNNLHELIAQMPTDKDCRAYLIRERWNGKPVCPYCENDKCYVVEKGKRFKCSKCKLKFSATVGTIFENTNVPLNKWFYAMYILTGHKKGISSYQLGRDIGVSQKSAWFMMHRIREAMKDIFPVLLDNVVEIDETFIGGKMKNKHVEERLKAHLTNTSHTDNKTGVMGFLQRGVSLRMNVIPEDKTLKNMVCENVAYTSMVITDSHIAYSGLDKKYAVHSVVDHKADEYVRGAIYTNSIEGAFGLFKRMIIGIYHQTSVKHLPRYLDEFTYRYNSRKITDAQRFNITLTRIETRLTYKQLTGKP